MTQKQRFSQPCAIVIGAGAQGLSCALKLLDTQAFRSVEVVFAAAGMVPPNALWELPCYNVEPQELVDRWALSSFADYLMFLELFGAEETGITFPVRFYGLSRSKLASPHPFRHLLKNFKTGPEVLREVELQAATNGTAHLTYADAEAYDALTLNTRKHFAFLRKLIEEKGGTFRQTEITSPDELNADVIVNCCGIDAFSLEKDKKVFPIRGIVAHADLCHVKCAMSDAESHSYAIPAIGQELEIGGTAEKGNWNRKASQSQVEDLFTRAREMIPAISQRNPEHADVWTGLRPGREGGVRFETEFLKDKFVIHNYGHGGAGVITSLGAAQDVAAIALDFVSRKKSKL